MQLPCSETPASLIQPEHLVVSGGSVCSCARQQGVNLLDPRQGTQALMQVRLLQQGPQAIWRARSAPGACARLPSGSHWGAGGAPCEPNLAWPAVYGLCRRDERLAGVLCPMLCDVGRRD